MLFAEVDGAVGAAFRHAGANAVAFLHAGEPLSVHYRHSNGGIATNAVSPRMRCRCGMVGNGPCYNPPRNERSSGGLLVDATLRRLVAACFLNQLGFQSVYFVGIIGCATYELGLNVAGVSALVFALNVVLLVGYSLAGTLIDRMGPKPALLAASVAPLAAATLALALPMSFLVLLACALVMGLAGAAASTAVETYPRYLTANEPELVRLNSLNSTATFTSVIVGPFAAGVIADTLSTQLVFALLLATAPAAMLCAFALPAGYRHAERGATPASSLLSQLANGARAIMASPALLMLFAIGFLGNLGFGAFDSLESLFYRDVLRVGAEWMGWLSTIVGVGATLGSVAAGRLSSRRVTIPLLCALLVLEGLGAVLYVGTPLVACACAGQLVLGVANGAITPIRVTLTQRSCDIGRLGSVSALMRVALSSAGTLPLLAAPFLADAFGVQPVLVVASASVVVAGSALLVTSRRVAEEGAERAAENRAAASDEG